MLSHQERQLVSGLLDLRGDTREGWAWLSECAGRPADKRSANKFLLACSLDYQMLARRAWDNARVLAEDVLGDPDDLWDVLAGEHSDEDAFADEFRWLHRFPIGRKRVIRIARGVVREYGGDGRRVWAGQSPAQALSSLVAVGLGQQLSRMAVGALVDTLQIGQGPSDIKPDIHASRVIGRCVLGSPVDAATAVAIARRLHPQNPWAMNRGLYEVGRAWCHKSDPACKGCPLSNTCVRASRSTDA